RLRHPLDPEKLCDDDDLSSQPAHELALPQQDEVPVQEPGRSARLDDVWYVADLSRNCLHVLTPVRAARGSSRHGWCTESQPVMPLLPGKARPSDSRPPGRL